MLCVPCQSPLAHHISTTWSSAALGAGQACSSIRTIALAGRCPWNTLPPDTCVVCNLPSSGSLIRCYLISDTLLKTAPLYHILLLAFIFPPSPWPHVMCSITSQSLYKVHHCLVALKKVLNFKAQLNSAFHLTASYSMFLKIRQKEGPLSQIKM